MTSETQPSYHCKRCGYTTGFKSNLMKHLKLKNACSPACDDIDREVLLNEIEVIRKRPKEATEFPCKVCGKYFSARSNQSRHQKTCKVKGPDMQNVLLERINKLEQKLEEQQANQATNSNNNSNNNNSNNNSNNTINNTIHINNFGREDTSYLVNHPSFQKFMVKCIKSNAEGVMDFLTKKHFHPDHPENHNIRKLNKKDEFIEVRSGKKWKLRFKEDVLEDVFSSIQTDFLDVVEQAFTEDGQLKRQWLDKFMAKVGEPLDWDLTTDTYEYKGDMTNQEKEFLKNRIYRLALEEIYRNSKLLQTDTPTISSQ